MDPKTGNSKGFGFVEMALAHEGEVACEELHNSLIDNKKIRVKPAEDKPE